MHGPGRGPGQRLGAWEVGGCWRGAEDQAFGPGAPLLRLGGGGWRLEAGELQQALAGPWKRAVRAGGRLDPGG